MDPYEFSHRLLGICGPQVENIAAEQYYNSFLTNFYKLHFDIFQMLILAALHLA